MNLTETDQRALALLADLAELARLLVALTGPQPATFTPTVTWSQQPAPPASSSPSPAPSPPPAAPGPPANAKAVSRLLQALHDRGGAINDPAGHAVRTLTETLGVTATRVGQLLRRAEAAGLVTRTLAGKRRTTRIALTADGRALLGGGTTPAPAKPDLSAPRVVEVLEEDDAPLVFKTREQRQQEIRDAQADALGDL